ncbi:hypothetical protein ACIP3B_35910 [Streptomyces anulatus]|uniref:hypothetical protein n=1 Tax=Streptomyces anulatus TaxID=1892 RepID=UPI00340F6FD2
MGQNPAQKAAQAARRQQPKKRPGKAQREASKRAQAARKKAGGGKPAGKKTAAKKAVPLPRGSLRAAYGGTCCRAAAKISVSRPVTWALKSSARWPVPVRGTCCFSVR